MKVILTLVVILGLVSSSRAEAPASAAIAPPISGKLGTPIQLFNAKDLDGWTFYARPPKPGTAAASAPSSKIDDTCTVKDGILHDAGKPTGYIRTNQSFTNYVLTVEQRHLKKSNGGVLIGVQPPDKVWPRCIEVQGQSGDEGDLWNQGNLNIAVSAGREINGKHVVKIGPASANALGEWDTMQITVDDNTLTVTVNGKLQNIATSKDKLAGEVALQAEGGEMEFRKVELTPIEDGGK
jgi:hypothetical protein